MADKYHLPLRTLEQLIAEMVGVDIPFNNYITGFSAFTHKAGIHAKAILNSPETYEALDPHDFGLTRYISIAPPADRLERRARPRRPAWARP